MSESIFAAIIGVGGAVIVSAFSFLTQLFITRTVIKSQKDSILLNEQSRIRERRLEKILDIIASILTCSDPQTEGGADYFKAIPLISRVEILLNNNYKSDFELNVSLMKLGEKLGTYHPLRNLDIEEKRFAVEELLQAQSEVITKIRFFQKDYYNRILK